MKKITFKIFLLTILLVMFGAVIGNICLAQTAVPVNDLSGYNTLPEAPISSTVAQIINAALGLLGILCVIGIFVCVPLGIYFLTKKELVQGTAGEKPLMDIGEIIRKGWNLYKNNFKLFINPLIILAASSLVFLTPIALIPLFENYNRPDLFIIAGLLFIILVLAYIFINLWMAIVIIKIIANLYLGQPVEMKKIYEESLHKVPSYLWVGVLLTLTIFGGFLLLIIPALIFSIWFNFATYTNVLANYKGVEAMRSSYFLVKGRWLDVFIRIFVCGLVISLISLAIMLIGSIVYGIVTIFAGDNIVLSLIYNLLTSILSLILMPLTVAFTVILYYSLVETRPYKQQIQPTAPVQQ